MIANISTIAPRLFYNDTVTTTNSGARLVFVSSKQNGGQNDRFTFALTHDDVDVINPTNLPTLPFGWNPVDPNDAKRSSLSVEASPEMVAFCEELDACNKRAAAANSNLWFKKEMDEDTVGLTYVPLCKEPNQAEIDKYQAKPKMSVKVTSEGDRATQIMVVVGTTVVDGVEKVK